MPLVNDIGVQVGEAIIKNVVANKDVRDYIRANTAGLSTVGLTFKLGLRFARTVHKARTDGLASFNFAGSATSSVFCFAALLCHTASKVLPYINCEQYVPLLASGAVSSSLFSDQLAAFDQNTTTTLADVAISAAS